MKVIIAGPRNLFSMEGVKMAADGFIKRYGPITMVVSGCAKGIDKMGEGWAAQNGIPVQKFPAEWHRLGFAAGPIRNAKMANFSDGLAAVWDGQSVGTADMLRCAAKRGLKIVCYRTDLQDYSDEIPERKKKEPKPKKTAKKPLQNELF